MQVLRIIHFMAPSDVLQDIAKGPGAHPDIEPAMLPSDPSTWEPYKASEPVALAPAAAAAVAAALGAIAAAHPQ